MGRESVVVEFLGLPGSGKSAVSRQVGAILEARGWSVEQPSFALAHRGSRISKLIRKGTRVAAEAIGHPVDSLASSRLIGTVPHPSPLVRVKMTFNWLLVSHLVRRAGRRKGVHLLDQGPLQGLWSIAFGSGAENVDRIGARLCARIPPPDLVAIIDAEDATIGARLHGRPEMDSRMDRFAAIDADLLRRCRSALASAQRVMSNGSGSGSILVVRNETAEDLRQGAERIAASIAGLVAPDSRGSDA